MSHVLILCNNKPTSNSRCHVENHSHFTAHINFLTGYEPPIMVFSSSRRIGLTKNEINEKVNFGTMSIYRIFNAQSPTLKSDTSYFVNNMLPM